MKPNIKYPLNLPASLLAAMLVEQEIYTDRQIVIKSDPKSQAGQLDEVTRTAVDKKKDGIIIFTESSSPQQQELLDSLEKDSPFRLLQEVMEDFVGQFKSTVFEEERQHVLGTSEVHTWLVDFPDFLDLDQRRRFAYYLPWKTQIQADNKLMQRCFSSVIGLPVTLTDAKPKSEEVQGVTVDTWVLGSKDSVGGKAIKSKPGICIEIGPVPTEELPAFVPGSRQRRFLEEVLFANFLEKGLDWEIKVIVEKKATFFRVSDYELGVVGINSYIQ